MIESKIYQSKEAAGKILANDVENLQLESPYVMAILRGGIQVAKGIADRLKVPINPLVVKKLPSPGNPEYGFGAITEDGTKVLNPRAVSQQGLTEVIIEGIAENIVAEIQHRKELFGELDDEKISNSNVIIVDDGVATGYSLIAGINTIKNRNPKSITVVVPVSADSAYSKIKPLVDKIICPIISDDYFFAVAMFYRDWFDLSEDEIKEILDEYKEKYGKK